MLPRSLRPWLILAISHTLLLTQAATTAATLATDATANNDNTTLPLLAPNSTTWRRILYADHGRDDYATSGNYQILLCDADRPDSKAARLQRLLPLIRQNLQAVIHDVQSGTASQYGYGAFFKTDDNRAAVADVFRKMSDGDPVRVSADRAMRLGSLTASPTFACMDEGDAFTRDLYAQCVTGKRFNPLMTWGATELIMICPSFWTLPVALTRTSCPRVVDSKMVPNDEALIRSMYAVIVRMLAHIYVPESSIHEETVDNVQDAIELNATESLVNANSYALYATAVQLRCSNWPIVSQCEAQGTCAWPSS